MNKKLEIDSQLSSKSSPKSPSPKSSSPKSPSPTYLSPRTQEYNSKYKCYAPKISTRKIINNSNFQKFRLEN
jgi:hypothetical protein